MTALLRAVLAALVLTAWPASDEFSRPWLGYVSRPFPIVRIEDFTAGQVAIAAAAINQFDVALVFSTKYQPARPLLEDWLPWQTLKEKYFGYHRDLPPEAEVPIINIEVADSRFASAYLSFNSKILEANQITDFLVRVVQPRLTAIEGVQKANLLGGRTFAMRIWLKPDRLAAFNINAEQVRQALAANNFLSAVGYTKGSLVQVNLSANTDLRSVEEFRNLVIRQSVVRRPQHEH